MSRKLLLLTLSGGLAALPAAAQPNPTSRALGWVNAGHFGVLEVQDVGACATPAMMCTTLAGSPSALAGGTAYDPIQQSVWVSDGVSLQEIALRDCSVPCSMPAQLMDPQAVVSGLAITGRQRLIQLETRTGYVGLRSYDASVCPPNPLRDGCQLTVGANATATGLAYDEVRDLLYIAVSEPAGPLQRVSIVVTPAGAMCLKVCEFVQQGVGFRGLAYDTCSQRLWATTGGVTLTLRVVDPYRCVFQTGKSCLKTTSGDFAGLAVVPGWTRREFGSGCTGTGCAQCPALAAQLIGGDPALGNASFATQVANGPVPGAAFLVLAAGTCSEGAQVPGLCGRVFPRLSPPPAVLSAGALTGSVPCGGSATIGLPIPVNPSMCGSALCLQWVVGCGAAVPTGVGLTGAVQFTITGT